MKLAELEPRWFVSAQNRHGQGVTFLCPLCGRRHLGVAFANPLDGGPPMADQLLWTRTGDTFEHLTLSPSLDASIVRRDGFADGPRGDEAFALANRPCVDGGEIHWHGYVTGGEIR